MEYYTVYVQIYDNNNTICNIAYFKTFELAENYLMDNGINFTKKFEELYGECVFWITTQKNLTLNDLTGNIESILEKNKSNFLNPTYVFSSQSYSKYLEEHEILVKKREHDIIPTWLCYVKNNKRIYGITEDRFYEIPNISDSDSEEFDSYNNQTKDQKRHDFLAWLN